MRAALLVCLLLAGCGGAPVATEVVRIAPDCGSLPYPRPVPASPVKPENAASHWEFSHEDYVTLRNWFVELDRWLDDTRTLMRSVQQCHEDMKAAVAPPPAQPEGKWWQWWK